MNASFQPPPLGPKLASILGSVDPTGMYFLDVEAQDRLLELAEDFATRLAEGSTRAAKHRGGGRVEVKDVGRVLKINWGMEIPGFDLRGGGSSTSNAAGNNNGVDANMSGDNNNPGANCATTGGDDGDNEINRGRNNGERDLWDVGAKGRNDHGALRRRPGRPKGSGSSSSTVVIPTSSMTTVGMGLKRKIDSV